MIWVVFVVLLLSKVVVKGLILWRLKRFRSIWIVVFMVLVSMVSVVRVVLVIIVCVCVKSRSLFVCMV